MTGAEQQPKPQLTHWQRNRVLYITLAGMMATGFPFTILTVAIKPMAQEFGITEALATWTVSAPMLISAVCLPLMGKLGDTYGHRRLFLLGISGSTLFAAAAYFAWDIWSLIAFRVLSMFLAGATTPSGMALMFSTYHGEERNRAVGWWAMGGPGSAALGLILGGPMVDFLGWRSVFMFQILAGLGAWIIAARALPETEKRPAVFDTVGNIVLIVSLLCLMFVVGSISTPTVTAAMRWTAGLLSLLTLIGFLIYERTIREPIVAPRMLITRNFAAPSGASFLIQGSYLGALVATPIVLIDVFGFSISAAALLMLMRTASLTLATPFGGRLAGKIGERWAANIGIAIQTLGTFGLAAGVYMNSLEVLLAALVLQGTGHGLANPPLTSIIATAVRPAEFGTASGLNRLISQIGSSLGLSLFGALLAAPAEDLNLPMIFIIGGVITALAAAPALIIKPVRD